jgi:hypothetical protein
MIRHACCLSFACIVKMYACRYLVSAAHQRCNAAIATSAVQYVASRSLQCLLLSITARCLCLCNLHHTAVNTVAMKAMGVLAFHHLQATS